MVPYVGRSLIVNKLGATGEAKLQGSINQSILTLNFKNGKLKVM